MILLIGILIGFVGYVMISNINLSIIEISNQNKHRRLIVFIALVLIFECIYCFFSLYCLQLLMAYPKIILAAQYISIAFLFILGVWSLAEKSKTQTEMQENIIRRGYWSIFVHPQQIPFWFFWGIILIKKQLLQTDTSALIYFAVANAAGSFLVLMLYAKFGNKLISLLKLNRKTLKNIVGIICIGSAILLLIDILKAT